MTSDDGREGGRQPGVRTCAIQLAGLDKRGDDGPVLGPCVVAREEGVLAAQGDGTDGPLNGVAVDLDAAIGQEAAKAVSVLGDIAQRFAEGRLCGDAGTVVDKPVADPGKDRR